MQIKLIFLVGVLITVIVALGFGGFVLYRQNRILAELQAKINIITVNNISNVSKPAAVDLEAIKEQAREAIIDSEKVIAGEIKSIENNALTIEVQTSDFKGLLASDPQKPTAVALVTKSYRVVVDKTTKFSSGLKLSDFKVGDLVRIAAGQSIYNAESFVAVKIEKIKINFPTGQ